MADDRNFANTTFGDRDFETIKEFLDEHDDFNRAELLREGALLLAGAYDAAEATGWSPDDLRHFRHYLRQLVFDGGRGAERAERDA